jgi:hypothetical protein
MSIESIRKRLEAAIDDPGTDLYAYLSITGAGATTYYRRADGSTGPPTSAGHALMAHAAIDLALLLEVAEAAHVIAQQLPLLGWPKELANDDADMRLVAALDALHAAD